MARWMLSLGILASVALSQATRSRGLLSGSEPPARAATVISRMILVQSLPRLASWRPLRCWMLAHLLCPAIMFQKVMYAKQAFYRACGYSGRATRGRTQHAPHAIHLCHYFLRPGERAMPDPIVVAQNAQAKLTLLPALANRHGCITGAAGTGKTVTLQVLAEAFSRIGTPVFMADIKGDLTGISQAGASSPKLQERLKTIGAPEPVWGASPAVLWDVFGEQGVPVRATVSDMGPLLLARMLELNDTQEGVLTLVFRVADDEGQLLLDLKDLRAMLQNVADRAAELKTQYGNVSSASVGAIQRSLLRLESQGADRFFGEPMLDVHDLMRTDAQGRGIVSILAADKLMQSPRLYGVFLLWLLADLYEKLPEVGDREQPKLVFFFDEAHLLFDDAPKALLDKIEQVVRLVRSKGVGVYFVTQNPLDIPDAVLGQLGNRIQHALRAFTPRDQKAVKTAAQTMRPNPGLDIEAAITELGVGEALVSLLDEKGRPAPTERAWVMPPGSRIGPA